MCKINPIQYNGVDVTPENTLQFKEGGLLKFKDSYVMNQLARNLGYSFYLYERHVYAADVEIVSIKIASDADAFNMALPLCKNKVASANLASKSIPVAIAK